MNKYQIAWNKILEHEDKSNGVWTPQVREILLDNEKGFNLPDEFVLIQGIVYDAKRLYRIEAALHAVLGLSGDRDGYITCVHKCGDGTFSLSDEYSVFNSVEDMVAWYEENYPEEL